MCLWLRYLGGWLCVGEFCFLAWQSWKKHLLGLSGEAPSPTWRLNRERVREVVLPRSIPRDFPGMLGRSQTSINKVVGEEETSTYGRFLEHSFGLEPSFLSWWEYRGPDRANWGSCLTPDHQERRIPWWTFAFNFVQLITALRVPPAGWPFTRHEQRGHRTARSLQPAEVHGEPSVEFAGLWRRALWGIHAGCV